VASLRRLTFTAMSEPIRRCPTWMPPLAHPLVLGAIVTLAVRGIGLAWHYFGNDLSGQSMVPMPMTLFPAAFDYHYAVIIALALLLLLAWKLLPGARRFTLGLSLPVFGLVILLGQVDFEMLRLVGRRFSPSVLTTYGTDAVTGEVMGPLLADRLHTYGSLVLIIGGWLALGWIVWRGLRRATTPSWSWPWWTVLALVNLYLASVPLRYTSHRTLLQPPEITFLRVVTGVDRTPQPKSEAELTRSVREMLVPAAGQSWFSEKYPLIQTPATAVREKRVEDPPDIIVIAVESLRARHLGFIGGAAKSLTPQFDALAKESVVFPHFISNGYPSAPGFFALNTGALPHRNKTLTSEFPEHAFDALPVRLKALGYQRLAIWGGNAAMANELTWAQRWYDHVDYQIEGNQLEYHHSRGDAETFRVLIEHIDRADRATPGRPQFIFVATAGTHGPFSASQAFFSRPEDRADAEPFREAAGEDREDNYDHMLQLLDRQIGRLREFLTARPRRNNTVLVICGDHSVALTETVSYDLRMFPVDGVVWTGALVQGASRLVGAPRVETFPASQVDLMPTLLALAGDQQPTAAMGTDLLTPLMPEKRQAIAVRDDGYRLDRDGWSLFVSAENPADYFVHRSFQAVPRSRESDPGGPFTAKDARDLYDAVRGWSWLIEQNRVWPPSHQAP
jgi:arylsulfatase A-like enzyme